MQVLGRYRGFFLSLVAAVSLFFFWYAKYPYVMAYQEQMQMFLFDSNDFLERIAVPGGFARYCSEFFVQFGNVKSLGALALTIVLLGYQLLVWFSIRKKGTDAVMYLVSLLPLAIAMAAFGDENFRLSLILALIFALLAIVVYNNISEKKASAVFTIIMIPVLYWLAGPAVLVFAVYVALCELFLRRRYLLAVVALLLAFGCIYVSGYVVAYPLQRLFLGIAYYGSDNALPLFQVSLLVLGSVLPFAARFVPSFDEKWNRFYVAIAHIAAILLVVFVIVPKCFNRAVLEVMEADNLVRNQRWETIIRNAEKHNPDSPLTVAALNLALAMTGQQNDRALSFYQNGWEGAFPTYNTVSMTSVFLAEIYYYVGMINLTQRFAFEANEALPDNNKSGRLYKRLAETNLINGQYEVARRYLQLLEKTFAYSKWAKSTMELLYNEDAINSHKVYGYLRKVRLVKDFLYGEEEIDKMMGQLMMHDKDNIVAAQYLLLLPKLEGNQRKYAAYSEFLRKLMSGEYVSDSTVTKSPEPKVDGKTSASPKASADGHTGATNRVN